MARIAERTVASSYLKDVSTVDTYLRDEETNSLKEIDTAERKLIQDIFKFKPAFEILKSQLLYTFDDDSEKLKDLNVQEFVNEAPHKIRFSDGGRKWLEWLESALRGNLDDDPLSNVKGRKIWARSIIRQREQIWTDRKKFMVRNLRLVISLVRHHKVHGPWTDSDLIQEGNIGLMKAVERFDVTRGFRFSTYGMWWIRHHIRRYMSEKKRLVRWPVHVYETSVKISKFAQKIYENTGKIPTDQELSEASGISVEKIQLVRDSREVLFTTVKNPEDGDESSIFDFVGDPSAKSPLDEIAKEELERALRVAMQRLTPFESDIIRWRFGFGNQEYTLQQIGEAHNLSRERIRQIEEKAKQKLSASKTLKTLFNGLTA